MRNNENQEIRFSFKRSMISHTISPVEAKYRQNNIMLIVIEKHEFILNSHRIIMCMCVGGGEKCIHKGNVKYTRTFQQLKKKLKAQRKVRLQFGRVGDNNENETLYHR